MATEKKRCIKHYRSSQKILLVGEGNFSFSSCLATAFGSATNMVATSFDDKETWLRRYGINCKWYLEDLEERGCLVLHEVDVHDMNQHPTLKSMKFDVIIFNFPHAGHFGLGESNKLVILSHKELLKAFFENASEMLNEGGVVHVTHRDDHPYKEWKLEELGLEAGLCLKEKVEFLLSRLQQCERQSKQKQPNISSQRLLHFQILSWKQNPNFPNFLILKFNSEVLEVLGVG